MTPEVSRCSTHGVPATGVCDRCGRFGCAECLPVAEVEWCADCLARPEIRLRPSRKAKQAMWLSLAGLHGVVVLLPIAGWLARSELLAIAAGRSPAAGRPWAQGALWLSIAGGTLWLLLLLTWLS